MQEDVLVQATTESTFPPLFAGGTFSISESTVAPFITTMLAAPECAAVEEEVATPVLLVGSPSDEDTDMRETQRSWWQSAAAVVVVSLSALLPFSNRRQHRERDESLTKLREKQR